MLLEMKVLYTVYVLFYVSIFFFSRSTMEFMYLSNIAIIFTLGSYLIVTNKLFKKKLLLTLSLIAPMMMFLIISIVYNRNIYSLLLIVKIAAMFFFFSSSSLKDESLVKFFNVTYILYLLLSAALYFRVIPNFIYVPSEHFTNETNLYFFKYYIMFGAEGSAAYLDSYSALVVLINIFLIENKNKFHYLSLFLSTLGVIASLRMTPLVALFAALAAYYFIRNKYAAVSFLLLIKTCFILTLGLLYYNPYLPQVRIDFWAIAYAVTHARSMIWEQQLDILWRKYSFVEYLLGGYSSRLFEVPAFQLWGEAVGTYYDNPHNTYLLLFFRMPIFFVILYTITLYLIFKNYEKKSFVIITFILVTCYTNSTIISLQNPVYIIMLTFMLSAHLRSRRTNYENIMCASRA